MIPHMLHLLYVTIPHPDLPVGSNVPLVRWAMKSVS